MAHRHLPEQIEQLNASGHTDRQIAHTSADGATSLRTGAMLASEEDSGESAGTPPLLPNMEPDSPLPLLEGTSADPLAALESTRRSLSPRLPGDEWSPDAAASKAARAEELLCRTKE